MQHGKAALHLACENGHQQVADVLLWHKAFVNAKSKLGFSPLHLAAATGYNNLVKLLLETHGAAIDACSLVSSVHSSAGHQPFISFIGRSSTPFWWQSVVL